MTIGEIWRRITTTRYTRALEEEVERLRAENRALVNSILGVAGIPPLRVNGAPESRTGPPSRRSGELGGSVRRAREISPEKAAGANGGSSRPAAPLRRRSWQQILRALEIEAARQPAPAGSPGPAGKEPETLHPAADQS